MKKLEMCRTTALYTCSNHLFVTFTSSEPGLQSFVFTFLFDIVSLGCPVPAVLLDFSPNVCFAESKGCGVGLVYMTEDEV
jgi:hypothetical protein